MLKIITGSAKGKTLKTLEGEATRPTSERIKEAIFSSLQFDLEERRVLDLFAGCGQLGLEALSRGSRSVTFVDASREAMEIVKENARRCGFFDRCRYAVSDYRNFVRKASGRDIYDLVLIDPPYAAECCAEAVARLEAAGVLADGAIVVCECGTEPFDPASFAHFDILKSTHYGKKNFVNILLYRKPEEGDGEPP